MFEPNDVDMVLDQAQPVPSELLSPGAEAPASATLHVWDKDNYGCMFTIRDTNATNLYVRVQAIVAKFKRDGWKPDWKTEGSTTPPQGQKAVVSQPTTSKGSWGKCSHCGADNKWSAVKNKPYCGDLCWKK
jgi:hypothetical protein